MTPAWYLWYVLTSISLLLFKCKYDKPKMMSDNLHYFTSTSLTRITSMLYHDKLFTLHTFCYEDTRHQEVQTIYERYFIWYVYFRYIFK